MGKRACGDRLRRSKIIKIFLFHQFSKMVLVFLIFGIYFLCLSRLCEINTLVARGREKRTVSFWEKKAKYQQMSHLLCTPLSPLHQE